MASLERVFFLGHSHAPPDACNEAGAHCLAQRVVGAEALGAKLSPIKTETGSSHFAALRDASDAGGAASGHSDTTYQALLPASATAAAAEGHAGALLTQREPASPDSVVTAPKPVAAAGTPASAPVVEVPHLVPLTPPDASEGPEAAAEYEIYLQRWDAGDTLAQRWHRLAQSGKLADIRAEWDDWQLDLMLTQVRARAQAAQAQQRSGAVTPSNGGGSRLRRGRAEAEEATDSQAEEPRRVRSRRAPSTLQDYHVENTPGRTPERQDAEPAPAAPAAAGPADPVSDDSTDEAPYSPAAMQQYQQQQQAQQQRPGLPRAPAAQQAPRRPSSRLQQQLHQQQQQQARQFNRVITPYNPQLIQHQQMQRQAHAQVQAQQQARVQYAQRQQAQAQAVAQLQQQPQQMMVMMQQLMAQLQHNMNPGQQNQQVPPEMTEMWFKIGSALGAMMQEKGGPANLLTNPQAMSAMVEAVLRQTTGDPDAAMQQLMATMAASNAAM